MASVSVVIPCYNYGRFLESCVDSVLSQTGVEVRAAIIDDASPDGSADVARAIAARDPRVEVIAHEVNQGHLATFNEGILDWADGDYTILISADDSLTPGALERAVALLEAHPDVAFAYGHPIHYDDRRPLPAARTGQPDWAVWNGQWWVERRLRKATGCITSPEVVVRTSVQKQVGGYEPDLPYTGDQTMWMRLALRGRVGYLRGVDQAYYRLHGSSMTRAQYASNASELRERKKAYDRVLELDGDRLGDRQMWADLVHRRFAKEALWEACRAYDRSRTDEVSVEDLRNFASLCWPQANRLPGWWTLRARQAIGPSMMPKLQPLVLTAPVRKARVWWWWHYWARYGI